MHNAGARITYQYEGRRKRRRRRRRRRELNQRSEEVTEIEYVCEMLQVGDALRQEPTLEKFMRRTLLSAGTGSP